MKKFLSIFCALITTISLTACNISEEPDSGSSEDISNSSDVSSENIGSDNSDMGGEPIDKTELLPNIDGSTSAIPLDAGLRSGFLGISYAQAKEQVSHTTTHDSFKRLIGGEVDLIFSVPISAEQQQAADDAGVQLFMEPVAKEGFVFVVNANNPVDSLTSDQIRKIYSGEITNWSQVGGEDREILAYQRNNDSGSQNYMTVFMGDTPLIKPKTELIAGGMAGIMNAVAIYDNSAGAIGYSVYSYAAQMYADTSNVKFIAVDGAAPSKQTMADESYPLLSCTYLIYTDKSPEKAKDFTAWALSDEGQTCVLESGYLPVNGMTIPEKYFPYEAVGTGAPKPAGLLPSRKCSYLLFSGVFDENSIIRFTNNKYELNFLKNKELQDKINSDIAETIDKMQHTMPAESGFWSDGKHNKSVELKAVCRNGYLSLMLLTPLYGVSVYDNSYDQVETLTYDLFSGEKTERFSDLFYEGENFVPLINKQLGNKISVNEWAYFTVDNPQRLDFSCILGEPHAFTIDSVGFDYGTYFSYACFVDYTSSYEFNESDYLSIASQYRDMTSLIEDEWSDKLYEYDLHNEWKTTYINEGEDTYIRFTGSDFHTPEEVEAQDKFWHELQRRAWEHIRKTNNPDFASYMSIGYGRFADYYNVGCFTVDSADVCSLSFDADTLEIITMEMLAGGDWKQFLSEDRREFAEYTFYPTSWWYKDGNDIMTVYAYPAGAAYRGAMRFEIPVENINKKYLEIK